MLSSPFRRRLSNAKAVRVMQGAHDGSLLHDARRARPAYHGHPYFTHPYCPYSATHSDSVVVLM